MNRGTSTILWVLLGIVAAACLLWSLTPRSHSAFRTPIAFYGKVVDQLGNPVPDANGYLAATDSASGKSSKYERQTDIHGQFSIKGIRGMSLYVEVDKPGMRKLPVRDGARGWQDVFRYAVPTGEGIGDGATNPRSAAAPPACECCFAAGSHLA